MLDELGTLLVTLLPLFPVLVVFDDAFEVEAGVDGIEVGTIVELTPTLLLINFTLFLLIHPVTLPALTK